MTTPYYTFGSFGVYLVDALFIEHNFQDHWLLRVNMKKAEQGFLDNHYFQKHIALLVDPK